MKVIFLDFDGVVNKSSDPKGFLDPEKIALIKSIVEQTGAKIVISSNWRYDLKDAVNAIQELQPFIIDRTPLYGDSRVQEITAWLENHKGVTNFAVIDDLDLDIDNLIHTNEDVGITEADAKKAVAVLNSKTPLMEFASVYLREIVKFCKKG